jgi:hypothetical protein
MPSLTELLPYLHWSAVALFFLAAICMGIALLSFRRARLAPYFFLREAARKRGVIWLVAAIAWLALGLIALYLT